MFSLIRPYLHILFRVREQSSDASNIVLCFKNTCASKRNVFLSIALIFTRLIALMITPTKYSFPRSPTRFQIMYALAEISFQNTKQFSKHKISFQNTKSVFKTQISFQTQIQFSKHKSPLKYTKSVFKS